MPLVNTKKMLEEAYSGGYAVGAFNISNMETVQGITTACSELRSPAILQVSPGAIRHSSPTYLTKLVEAAIFTYPDLPVVLHLDHGPDFDICKNCIDMGFTSVMIDGSNLSYEENVSLTKSVVDYAHPKGVTVEGELGRISGMEDKISTARNESFYTEPAQAEDFVKKTGVDSLAIAIGTSHGVYKFKGERKAQLRFDILEEIQKRLPKFPIVLHGSSSINPKFIKDINKFGGKIQYASGMPEEILNKLSKTAVCKINIDSDLRLAITAAIRKYLFLDHPCEFDPRGYFGIARKAVEGLVAHKIKEVLGSEDKI
ncbi:MAG: ketose-bisphosphate aldolase [Oscillospiraceae bacterium]|jgi:fructose-bisphosphate aldolase class II|nr:ketose-bisphosphate aldolase [Oscillospiraceae bacterium]